MSRRVHLERHRARRVGWLRAAVLGANDGIVSTASLIVGVAAANAGRSEMLLAGVAGLVAGAMSMAAGEYVSVSSQADTEGLFAGLALEGATLREDLDDNAVLYGKKLEHRDIVTQGVRPPKAAEKLLALLDRYSSKEGTH